eukprot:GILJ01009834.1.p1 GENE.GILJ01009834.1~~GILJ01009834.1.p1  ORF type:complete len:212 (+),score=6.51 GILJ01009834.1:63-698(+)
MLLICREYGTKLTYFLLLQYFLFICAGECIDCTQDGSIWCLRSSIRSGMCVSEQSRCPTDTTAIVLRTSACEVATTFPDCTACLSHVDNRWCNRTQDIPDGYCAHKNECDVHEQPLSDPEVCEFFKLEQIVPIWVMTLLIIGAVIIFLGAMYLYLHYHEKRELAAAPLLREPALNLASYCVQHPHLSVYPDRPQTYGYNPLSVGSARPSAI